MLNDYGKFYLLLLAMILGTVVGIVLILVGEATAGAGIVGTTLGSIIGYLTGNGMLAARGEAPSPVYTPTPETLAQKETQHDA